MLIVTNNEKIILSSEYKTEEFANIISKKLKLGDIVFLYGEMGVGKTTFIKYLINTFQKQNKLELTEVTSPTFNILNEYEINKVNISHYDLFRLKSPEELKDFNLFEKKLNEISLIEWPEIIDKKPKNLIKLFFKYEDDHKSRSVLIKGLDL